MVSAVIIIALLFGACFIGAYTGLSKRTYFTYGSVTTFDVSRGYLEFLDSRRDVVSTVQVTKNTAFVEGGKAAPPFHVRKGQHVHVEYKASLVGENVALKVTTHE